MRRTENNCTLNVSNVAGKIISSMNQHWKKLQDSILRPCSCFCGLYHVYETTSLIKDWTFSTLSLFEVDAHLVFVFLSHFTGSLIYFLIFRASHVINVAGYKKECWLACSLPSAMLLFFPGRIYSSFLNFFCRFLLGLGLSTVAELSHVSSWGSERELLSRLNLALGFHPLEQPFPSSGDFLILNILKLEVISVTLWKTLPDFALV